MTILHSLTVAIRLLELGADDYVTKPFSPRELLARVGAKLRHIARTPDEQVVRFDDISVDFKKVEVKRDGKPVFLTAHEFKMFQFLAHNTDRVISRDELPEEVWGYRNYPSTRTVAPTFSSSAKNWRKTHPGRHISSPTRHRVQVRSLILVNTEPETLTLADHLPLRTCPSHTFVYIE